MLIQLNVYIFVYLCTHSYTNVYIYVNMYTYLYTSVVPLNEIEKIPFPGRKFSSEGLFLLLCRNSSNTARSYTTRKNGGVFMTGSLQKIPNLYTKHYILRRIATKDAPALFPFLSDLKTMKYPYSPPRSNVRRHN
jgi:hypothetical protein